MSSTKKYGTYNEGAAEDDYAEGSKSSGGKYLKLKEGKNRLRFLPPYLGMSSPFMKVHQHFFKMPGSKKPIVFNCPRQMKAGYDCPACAKADDWQVSGTPAQRKLAEDMRPSARYFALVVDRDDEEKGVQILGLGKSILKGLSDIRRDEDYGGDFTHPEEGMDVYIKRVGQGLDTRYTVHPGGRTTPLGNDHWLETMQDIREQGKVLPLAEIQAKLTGNTNSNPSEFRDETPRRRMPANNAQTDLDTFGADDHPEDL